MRYRVFFVLAVVVTGSTLALRAAEPDAPPSGLETLEKRFSYAFAYQLSTNVRAKGAQVDVDAFVRGFKDGTSGAAPVMSALAMQQAMQEYDQVLRGALAEKNKELVKKNKEEGARFLEENKKAEGVTALPSGLQYKVVQESSGEKPGPEDIVVVRYEGKLLDGTVFDSTEHRGNQPLTIGVNNVIKGWSEGLQLMTVGSTYMFYIPGDLAYGAQGFGQLIGPNATLVFKVELVKIEARAKKK